MSEEAGRARRPRRHHLLWTSPAWHAAALKQIAAPELRVQVAGLLAAGWPMVVRRPSSIDHDARDVIAPVASGLPLPPALGKHRLPFVVPREAIVRMAPPLALADVVPGLPPGIGPPLRRLLRSARTLDADLRVYGSAAWQALTGHAWLTPASDVDFLWRARDSAQIAGIIALLEAWEGESGIRADGEILFGDDDAVAWREWKKAMQQSPVQRVIVKSLRSPRLCAPSELLARLRQDRVAAET